MSTHELKRKLAILFDVWPEPPLIPGDAGSEGMHVRWEQVEALTDEISSMIDTKVEQAIAKIKK